MAFEPDRVETVTFDSYSTLVDPGSAARVLPDGVEDPEALAHEWHARAAGYASTANYLDAYATYYDLHRDALEYLLDREGASVADAELDEMNAVYHDLDPFDDVREGFERLHDAGYRLAILSNGDPAMLDTLVETARIGHLIDAAVSADEIETFKPAVELYDHAAERVRTPVERIAHVSNGVSDVQGAAHAGMQGVWINRTDAPPEPFDGDPDLTVGTLHELADALSA